MTSTITDRVYGESSGVAVKAPCIAVSAGIPLPLVGLTSVGSYTPNPGDRILVKDQTDPSTNGIYNASASAWQRTGDFDGPYDCVQGTLIVAYLPTGVSLLYQLTTLTPIIGTTPLTFLPYSPIAQQYPIVQAEINAGVTPTLYFYPPGDLRRYGWLGDGVTNNYAAWQQALAVCVQAGIKLIHPYGNGVINTASGTLNCEYVTIQGTGVTDGSATPAAAGSVISVTGTANSPFTVGPGVTFEGVGFFYPAQVDTAAPIVFPPTLVTSLAIGGAINFTAVNDCTVFNAYRFFVDADTTGSLGHCFFENNTIYGILTCFEIAYNAEIITFTGNEFTFGHYLAATEGGLRGYTRANGSVLKVIRTDGITFQGNVCYGYLNGINFVTSATICQLTSISNNYFDQCLFPIIASGTGNVVDVTITGNVLNAVNFLNTALIGNIVKITTSGALALESIAISSNILGTCTGDAILISGSTAPRSISVTSNQINGIGAFQTTGSYGCLNITGAATSYLAQGNFCTNQTGTPAVANGVLGSVSGAVIMGNIFGGYQTAINATFNNVMAAGNWSYGTVGAASNNYPASANVFDTWNNWDKNGFKSPCVVPIGQYTNAANDAAASAAGVPIGGMYRNASVVQVRVT